MEGETSIVSILCSEGFRTFLIALGVLVAIISVVTARSLARKKQTADMLFASRSDSKLQEGYKHIADFHNGADKNIRTLADSKTEEAYAVKYVLNHFELLSVGIQAGIYDEDMIKNSWCMIVCDTYERTQPLIKAVREKQKTTVLQEFEWLATRWDKNPLKCRKK